MVSDYMAPNNTCMYKYKPPVMHIYHNKYKPPVIEIWCVIIREYMVSGSIVGSDCYGMAPCNTYQYKYQPPVIHTSTSISLL